MVHADFTAILQAEGFLLYLYWPLILTLLRVQSTFQELSHSQSDLSVRWWPPAWLATIPLRERSIDYGENTCTPDVKRHQDILNSEEESCCLHKIKVTHEDIALNYMRQQREDVYRYHIGLTCTRLLFSDFITLIWDTSFSMWPSLISLCNRNGKLWM